MELNEEFDDEELLDESLVGRLHWLRKDMVDATEDICNRETHICDIPYEEMHQLVSEWAKKLDEAIEEIKLAKIQGRLNRVLFNPSPFAKDNPNELS